jgi:Tol biopolymer transport system component
MTRTTHLGALTAAAGVLVAVGMLGLTMVALVDPAGAAFPGKNGKMVFSSNRDGNYEIYTMNSDRSGPPSSWNVQRLTNNPKDDTDPAFSADGSQIAFVSERDGNSEIYTMNSDGSGVQRATNEPGGIDYAPAFSPDGGWIAYTAMYGGNAEIYTKKLDGTGQQRLTSTAADDALPDWQPLP